MMMKKDKTIFICDIEATVGGTFPAYEVASAISYKTVDKLEYLEEQNREYRQLVERFVEITDMYISGENVRIELSEIYDDAKRMTEGHYYD